jgi:hypothetical protein
VTVASLPSASANNKDILRVVSDGMSASDCAAGGASSLALCISNGSVWVPLSGSGSIGYPSAGVAISSGSAWGTSLSVSSAPGANTIPETDGNGVLNVAAGFASTGPFKISGATQSKPAAPTSGSQLGWFDATNLLLQGENSSGTTVWTTVAPLSAATSHKWVQYIDQTGTQQFSQPACTDLSGVGAGCSMSTTAGGDLSGILPSPTVAKVNGNTPGGTCTNQFARSVDTSGRPTCTSIAAADLTATVIPATPVPAPGTSITLTAPRGYAICTNTCTVSVPAPTAGYEFCILNDDDVATAITLTALGSGAMYENSGRTGYGTPGTGTFTATAAAGNKVCIVGRDSAHYLTVSYSGTWTAN